MIHKIFPVGPLQCNCSVIGDEQTHEAMVIDPGDQIEGILEILRQEKLTLKQIVITKGLSMRFRGLVDQIRPER